jgi:predicted dehydrogenase
VNPIRALTKTGMSPADLSSLSYRPSSPSVYQPAIGLIGCGGITVEHLTAYRKAGFRVTAMCDVRLEQARGRAAEFFPQAKLYSDYRQLLDDQSIEVVDVATHPAERYGIISDCLLAGKHVLSQKPFVTDLEQGQELVRLARQQNVQLAVNQNARWAPHYRFAHSAISAGLLGEVFAVHLGVHWDHTWVRGTEFEKIRHLILYDFAIHWFDLVRYFLSDAQATSVFATTCRAPGQDLAPNLLAQVLIQFPKAQASLAFDAAVERGQLDQSYIAGTSGTIHSSGPSLQAQRVGLHLQNGCWEPELQGNWFPDGFHGTMGELLCAIQQNRPATISAADNLRSLELCLAALASADSGQAIVPGSVTKLAQ